MWYKTLFIIALCTVHFAAPAHAQTNSAQTTPSAELRQVIRDRIEQTLQEKKQPGAVEFLGTIGTITKINPSTFMLVDTIGRERTVEVNPETTTLLSAGKPIALSDITLNSSAVVMGLPADDIVIEARRVLVTTTPFTETREVFLGSIGDVTRTSLTMTTRGSEEIVSAPILRTSQFEDSLGNDILVTDLAENQSILLITSTDATGKRNVARVRLLVPLTE